MLYHDPPELLANQKRGDPPWQEWPGRIRTRLDVMAASGDERDWFRYHHRQAAVDKAWAEWRDARRRRRDFSAGFDWDQVLIIGPYGAFKTTLGIMIARHWFGLGHCVFSNASCLFGWQLDGDDMYTAMEKMPNIAGTSRLP